MKGGVVILLESLKRFLQQNDTDLCVVLNVDEELGSPLSGELFKEVAGMSSHCLSFEPGRENGELISSRKGIISLWLFARGKKGHASRLDEGANAIVELAFKVMELTSLNGRFPNLTLNPTIVKGGAESNVTPDKAEVYFDVRYYDDKEYEFLEETLKRLSAVHPEANVSYSLKLRRLPMKEDPDFVNIVKMSAEEIGMTVSFVRATGGGDVAFFSQNGVPSIDGLGIPGGKMHSEDEYARLDQFEDRVNLVVHLLRKLGGEKMFVDTTLRDGHQSLIATRMRTEDMLPALEAFDRMNFHSMEVWGGATFDVAVRFLNENPWERLKKIREGLKNTKIQMLLRGQNLVGYRHYADDVVELFIKKVAEYGLDIIRIFDALNDERNLQKSIEESKKHGLHVQVAISYTVSPVHTLDYYLDFARKLLDMGVDSICIKDMAGLLTPKRAYELVRALKEKFGVPVEVHSHCTTGFAPLAYQAAYEAGADFFDTAISPFSMGTSQPTFETMYYAFRGNGKEDFDREALKFLVDHFTKVRMKYVEYDVGMKYPDSRIIFSQIPGGMYSNLLKQLKEQRMEHLLDKVLEEVPRVQKDLGYPPLVTPTSQIVGVQAFLNVVYGRYERITNETKNYVKGLYGRPPAPIDPELMRKILGDEKPIDFRPADLLEPELDKARKELGILAETDEDLLIAVILGEVGKKFLRKKYEEKIGVDFNYLESLSDFTDDMPVYPV